MRVQGMIHDLEKLGLTEYVQYMQDRKRLFWTNFLAGAARGLGMAVGFSILGAVLIALIQRIAASHISGMSSFLADVVRMVQRKL